MPHYKDQSNNIHFIKDECYLYLLPDGCCEITEDEVSISRKPSTEMMCDRYVFITQKRLDDFSRTKGYDGILAVVTYNKSNVPKFASEAEYAIGARDLTWIKAYEIIADVKAGKRSAPTLEDFVEELPSLSWPTI